jgi:hypothetical protein
MGESAHCLAMAASVEVLSVDTFLEKKWMWRERVFFL